jgi:hypothetical protein
MATGSASRERSSLVPSGLTLSIVLGVALATVACGKPGVCRDKDLLLEIGGDHGHDRRIPKNKLTQGPGRYVLGGESHEHGFRLTEADIGRLQAGEAIELRSTSMNAHVHELRLKCAP